MDKEDKSSSAWRMWIEIMLSQLQLSPDLRHPPHGGCGLKYPATAHCMESIRVILRMEDVD